MGDVGQSGRDRLSPDVENLCPPFRGGQDDCCGVALAFVPPACPTPRSGEAILLQGRAARRRALSSSCRRGSGPAEPAPGPTRTATAWGRLSSSCSTLPSASSFLCCCASDPWS